MKISRFLKTILLIDFLTGLFIAVKEIFKTKSPAVLYGGSVDDETIARIEYLNAPPPPPFFVALSLLRVIAVKKSQDIGINKVKLSNMANHVVDYLLIVQLNMSY